MCQNSVTLKLHLTPSHPTKTTSNHFCSGWIGGFSSTLSLGSPWLNNILLWRPSAMMVRRRLEDPDFTFDGFTPKLIAKSTRPETNLKIAPESLKSTLQDQISSWGWPIFRRYVSSMDPGWWGIAQNDCPYCRGFVPFQGRFLNAKISGHFQPLHFFLFTDVFFVGNFRISLVLQTFVPWKNLKKTTPPIYRKRFGSRKMCLKSLSRD